MAVVFNKEDTNDKRINENKIKKHRRRYTQLILILLLVICIIIMLFLMINYIDNNNNVSGKNISSVEDPNVPIQLISRLGWNATSATNTCSNLTLPAPYVIIMHTATTECLTTLECVYRVKEIQKYHMKSRKYFDIAYNFLIGGDECVYEGRGWSFEGAHTYNYNSKSIGISFIGNFNNKMPSEKQIIITQLLIKEGVKMGFIDSNYKLFGARQLVRTLSPGAALYEELKKWPHWSKLETGNK